MLEFLALEGKTSLEAIVTIGRDVLHASEKKIDCFLNNWTEEIDATTTTTDHGFSSSEDEAAKEEAERGDDTNSGLTCYTYIMSYKYPLIMLLFRCGRATYGGGGEVGCHPAAQERGRGGERDGRGEEGRRRQRGC